MKRVNLLRYIIILANKHLEFRLCTRKSDWLENIHYLRVSITWGTYNDDDDEDDEHDVDDDDEDNDDDDDDNDS